MIDVDKLVIHKDNMEERKVLKAIDIDIPVDMPVKSEGIAYYRLSDEVLEFFRLCEAKHGILGFEWDGSRNFGVILKYPERTTVVKEIDEDVIINN